MAISLVKVVIPGANGNYTPNLLLNGFIEYQMFGSINVQAPFCVLNGQLFLLKFQSNNPLHAITWDAVYKDSPLVPGLQLPTQAAIPGYPGLCWIGTFI